MVDVELKEAEEVREKLNCQVSLLKLQIIEIMKQMDKKALDAADIKLDFKSKLVAESINLTTRKSSPLNR